MTGETAGMAETTGTPPPAFASGPHGTPARTRIVLADVARAELAEQTRVGEGLVSGLVRAQLALAVRLSVVVAIGLGGLPLLFAVAPSVGGVDVFGVKLPWLLLGVVAYPFLVGVGIAYVHLAERNEQDFTALVERPHE